VPARKPTRASSLSAKPARSSRSPASRRRPSAPPPPVDTSPPDLTPGGDVLLPLFAEVIDRWHAAQGRIASWEDALRELPASRDGTAGLAERILLINTFQWREEDRSRDPRASDAVLAAVKRSIDASNARRVQAVEAFDAHVIGGLEAAGLIAPEAPLHSESPGSIVDRLTVLALKVWHAREALKPVAAGESAVPAGAAATVTGSAPATEARALSDRLRSLEEQQSDLVGCLERLYADIAAGRARVKLYRQVKLYRDPATGRLRPDADRS